MIAGISRRCPPLNGLFASQDNFQNRARNLFITPLLLDVNFSHHIGIPVVEIAIFHVDYRLRNSHIISLKCKYLPLIREKG